MLLDKQTLFSDAQNLAQAAGTYISTNVYDLWGQAAQQAGPLGTPVFDSGRGQGKEMLIQVVQDFASGGAATVQAQVIAADSADLNTNPVVLYASEAVGYATLKAGYQFRIGKLPHGAAGKRYLGLKYVIAVAATTAGQITAGLVMDRQSAPGSIL